MTSNNDTPATEQCAHEFPVIPGQHPADAVCKKCEYSRSDANKEERMRQANDPTEPAAILAAVTQTLGAGSPRPGDPDALLAWANETLNPPTKIITICEKGHRYEIESLGAPGMFGSSSSWCGHDDCDEAPVVDEEIVETGPRPNDEAQMIKELCEYILALEQSPARRLALPLAAFVLAAIGQRSPIYGRGGDLRGKQFADCRWCEHETDVTNVDSALDDLGLTEIDHEETCVIIAALDAVLVAAKEGT